MPLQGDALSIESEVSKLLHLQHVLRTSNSTVLCCHPLCHRRSGPRKWWIMCKLRQCIGRSFTGSCPPGKAPQRGHGNTEDAATVFPAIGQRRAFPPVGQFATLANSRCFHQYSLTPEGKLLERAKSMIALTTFRLRNVLTSVLPHASLLSLY